MQYFLNGERISEAQALAILKTDAMVQGWDNADLMAYWNERHACEEARDVLNMLSGYTMEFVA